MKVIGNYLSIIMMNIDSKNINHSIEQYQQYQQNLFKLKIKS